MFKFNKESWFGEILIDNKAIYYQILLASLFINFFALMSAFFVMTVYDKVVPNSAISSLIALTIGMVIVHIFDFILKMLRAYFIDIAGQKLDDVVADRLYSKISKHDQKILGESSASTVSTIREFDTFRDFFTSSSMVLFIDVPFMLVFIVILWFIGGWVALVPTLIAPIVIGGALLIQPNLKGMANSELLSKQGKLSVLLELLTGHETIRTVAGGNFLKKKWLTAVSDQNKVGVISKVFANFATTFAQTAVASSQTFIIFFGVFLIASTDLTMGALVACVILSGRTLSPLVAVGGILTKINSALASFKKIDALMTAEAKDENFSDDNVILLDKGSIEVQNFTYENGDKSVLDSVNVKISHGEKVGIIGPVGGGKSTFLKALVGYHSVGLGNIKIDSFDINNIDSDTLRNAIAYVPQTIQLFSGRIQDNITAGMEGCSNEDIIRASKMANAHGFISSLPGGYDCVLKEGGNNLSGGQRQKIALARAFLRNPLIAIFDEPTNSLDGETENLMSQFIQTEYKDTTLILATHKLSLLQLVDRVLVIQDGKIVADGPKEKIVQQAQPNQNNQKEGG
jgi:ATP-binding cassette subfamily C protein LapB